MVEHLLAAKYLRFKKQVEELIGSLSNKLTELDSKVSATAEITRGIDRVTIKGDPGEKGEKGDPGKDGQPGRDGKDGKDGLNGKDGRNGRDGLNGMPGRDGIDGKDGVDGNQITFEEIKEKIESAKGADRIDASAIKNIGRYIQDRIQYLTVGLNGLLNGVNSTNAQRSRINFIEGANTTIEVEDNPQLQSLDVTISSTGGGGSSTWGDITGTLSDQTDLQSALDDKVDAAGDTMTGDLTLESSDAGGENTNDSTTRVNTQSYQRAQNPNHFGEIMRNDLMTANAKAMIAWRENYINPGTPRTVAWFGAHGLSNDGLTWHNHAAVEVPDLSGALQTALEIPYATWNDPNGFGISAADVYVRSIGKLISYGNIIKEGEAGTNRDIILSTGSRDSSTGKRWALRVNSTAESGGNAGSDFALVRYNDSGVAQDSPISVSRSTGVVTLNATSSSITNFIEAAQDAVGAALTDTNTVNLTYDDAANTMKADVDFGSNYLKDFRVKPVFFVDCHSTSTTGMVPFAGSAVVSGTMTSASAGLVTANHPGVVKFRSAAGNADSGFRLIIDGSALLLSGGEYCSVIFNVPSVTNNTIRLGFIDTATVADVTDGCYMEIPGSTTLSGKTASNGSRNTTLTNYTISTGTWYRAVIYLNAGATLVTFELYNDSGTLLWSDTLSSTIPTASGRETGCGIIGTNSTTSATDIVHVDALLYTQDRTLVR